MRFEFQTVGITILHIDIERIITTLSGWVWSPALVCLCLGAGLFFSLLTRFVQVRKIREMIRLLFSTDKSQKVGISSFQAFAMALSGRVGTGNIVGVATAIGYGGPGAIVWMWIIAFLGAGSAFVEATLAQIYKVNHNGQFRGGPAYYIERGLRCKWLAILFAVCSILACGLLMPPVQSNGIAIAFANSMRISPAIVGLVTALILGLVIIGGVKRIAHVAQIVAPFMAILYILLAFAVLICHASAIPAVLSDMFRSAIGTHEVFGGILGSTIAWGVKRGIYSNEAGQGTGPIVAGAAKVSHPVKQGLVQAFSVYVDTLLVCTATAVMLLATQTYNVINAETGAVLFQSPYPLGEPDVSYTSTAIGTLLGPNLGNIVIAVALAFFAFTTIMAYYYYAETGIVYLFGKGRKEHLAVWILRIAILVAVFYGSLKKASVAWSLGDIGVGAMAWINIIAILLLFPKAIRALRDYEKQQKEGYEPYFDPDKLHIENAEYWTSQTLPENESTPPDGNPPIQS
ncbi:MAG: alanine:cation symporter family protein [Bacteroidales bacterium]|nr:alanine:cation symporter family protein [Bacteroidales bacterium]